MKLLIPVLLSCIVTLQLTDQLTDTGKTTQPAVSLSASENDKTLSKISFDDGNGSGKMSATIFKNQDYLRAEIDDFPYDVHFVVLGATVYFSGANFKNVEKGVITSNSLKPVSDLMKRCTAGSFVVFDDIKVVGPDKQPRTIQALALKLY